MSLSQLLQQRDRTIYMIVAATALGYVVWRRLPQGGAWINLRRGVLAVLIALEWLLILAR